MKLMITLTGAEALAMRYAIELARNKSPELSLLNDDEIIAYLINRATGQEAVRS
jgi:hypothetical protein